MSEQDDEERTESATSKRLEDARRKGQVARSRDLNAGAVTVLSCAALYMFGARILSTFVDLMRSGLSLRFDASFNHTNMLAAFGDAALQGFVGVVPVLGAAFLAALLAPMTMSGWNFSTEALTPNFSRMNPITGIGRIFSATGWIELVKSILKFAVIAVIAYQVLRKDLGAIMGLSHEAVHTAIGHAAVLCGKALLLISCGLLLLAGVDVPLQLWQHAKQLRMTRQEIKEEMKESDGNPEVKGKIRRLQQEMARRRMMEQVPTADVVVTNPTHYAVALKYDENRNRAPMVVAKGVDEVAAKIRELAKENKVPLFEAPPLARVLFRHVDLNQEVPSSVYTAVAQVLTYIYQMRAWKRGEMPVPPARPSVNVKEDAPVK